jgi:hypothetical protein
LYFQAHCVPVELLEIERGVEPALYDLETRPHN